MKGEYVASLDQGTTGTRCVIFDIDGNSLGWSYRKHRQLYLKEGWVEQDPAELLMNSKIVMSEAFEKSGLEKEEVDSVGITNQRETIVAWDSVTGIPFHNAIVWQDSRTSDMTLKLKADHGQDFVRDKTGLVISPYFSASKLKWLQDNSDKFRASLSRGEAMTGTVDTWLIWNLTSRNEYSTDYTNASRTMLMDIHRREWDSSLIEFFGLKDISLPEIKTSMNREGFGEIHGGRFDGIRIMSDLGDQQAALVGEKCLNPGDTKITYGTGSFVLQNTGTTLNMENSGLLSTCAYGKTDGSCVFAIEGSTEVSGSLFDWLINLGISDSHDDLDQALSRGSGQNLYFVPAFNGLYSPYWDETARGMIIGLTGKTGKHDILKSALEAICFQVRDMVDAMPSSDGMLKVDGGPSVNNSLMQLQADILGRTIHRQKITQATAFGAAIAAGIASGLWGESDLEDHIMEADSFFHSMDEHVRDGKYRGWKRAVERTRNWSF